MQKLIKIITNLCLILFAEKGNHYNSKGYKKLSEEIKKFIGEN
tara:strand:- start:231 stop:359 length:129 start_codon:yes stop_codon:yes gene_type:complete